MSSTLAAPSSSARLSRGQLVAGAALLGMLAPGCARTETATPAYGAPAPTENVAPPPNPSASGGMAAAMYGAPPLQDEPPAPVAADAGSSVKAPDKKPERMMAPAYGGPPPSTSR